MAGLPGSEFDGLPDHIPFENLPDSTGSYSKMSKLIDRIRNSMKRKKK
jgi:hypothetical protein